jgi:hypothetical protein
MPQALYPARVASGKLCERQDLYAERLIRGKICGAARFIRGEDLYQVSL